MSIDDPSLPRSNPRPVTPNTDPQLHPLTEPSLSLANELGLVVDDLRQLYTDFGLRPYRVFSVVVRWASGTVGYGEVQECTRTEILPTPNVVMRGVNNQATDVGIHEVGSIRIDEISPNYTEADIDELFAMQPLPKGYEAFWEVHVDRRDGRTVRRRFVPADAPFRDAENFQWSGRFTKQDDDVHTTARVPREIHSPEEVDAYRESTGEEVFGW